MPDIDVGFSMPVGNLRLNLAWFGYDRILRVGSAFVSAFPCGSQEWTRRGVCQDMSGFAAGCCPRGSIMPYFLEME